MGCCCDSNKRIIIVKNNDTDFNDGNLLELRLTTSILDLSTFKATLTLGDVEKKYNDISSGVIDFNLSAQETKSLPYGEIDGVLNLIDGSNRVATLTSVIPFRVISTVENNAIATSDVDYTINVQQGGETILNIAVESAVSVSVGSVETLPAGSSAYVNNVGTDNHLILDFGIPIGDDGETATIQVGNTETLPPGYDAYVVNIGTESDAVLEFGIPEGEKGDDGEAGQDALINGVNTLSLTASDGLTLEQTGSNANISGATIQASISDIEALIPSQASSENQLADKNFVNSSIATNTANFIGTFNSVAELEDYSGTLTNNDYAFVVGTDAEGNTIYDRYKYTTATDPASWIFEYELNNSSFTAAQWAAINSGATTTNIALAESALQAGDDVSQLNNDAGYLTSSTVPVSDVQVNSTSVVTNRVANIPLATNGGNYGVVKLAADTSYFGLKTNQDGLLYIVGATDQQITNKQAYNQPILPNRIDLTVKTGLTTNTLTLNATEKTTATNWILPAQTANTALLSDGTNATWDSPIVFCDWED